MQTNKSFEIALFFGYANAKQRLGIGCSGLHTTQTKGLLVSVLILAMMFLGAFSAQAQNAYYIRSGANGTNNGSDWTNAYTSLPSTLVRGSTYYIADGSYSDVSINLSGTSIVTIKKCPSSSLKVDSCQSVAGWNDAYGDDQAIFSGSFWLNSGYVTIDGQTEYGIKIIRSALSQDTAAIRCAAPSCPNLTVQYVEMQGPGGATAYNYLYNSRGVDTELTTEWNDNMLISHCKIHGFSTGIKIADSLNSTIEYCDMYDMISSNANIHQDGIYITGTCGGLTIRHNKMHNYSPEGIYFSGPYEGTYSGVYIYGNTFYNNLNSVPLNQYSRGVETDLHKYNYGKISNLKIYNNTFVNLWATFRITSSPDDVGPGSEFRNNLMYNAGGVSTDSDLVASHNTIASSNPFVDLSRFNLRLSSPTEAGYALSSPYNTDMDGNTRGSDGTWDRGAYEFGGSSPSPSVPPSPPTQLRIISQ